MKIDVGFYFLLLDEDESATTITTPSPQVTFTTPLRSGFSPSIPANHAPANIPRPQFLNAFRLQPVPQPIATPENAVQGRQLARPQVKIRAVKISR